MNILISPFKVVNYPFISQLLLHNENILKEIYYSLLYIEMIKFSYHCLLILQILLIRIYQSIPLIYHTPNVVKYRSISIPLK